tara:strand:+ start:475 stop:813 length:339 start_codon:yes stop_codon:yes gene_type:complete
MVHKNYKWNISKEEGGKIAKDIINEILTEQKNNSIELNELIFLLNNRTNKIQITNHKKKKNLVNFLKVNFGGIRVFLNELSNVRLLEEENKVIVHYINIINLNDWVFIDDSD